MALQHIEEPEKAAQKPTYSQEHPVADAESQVAAQNDEMSEKTHGLSKSRFAILFTCIILGSFLIGYVRISFYIVEHYVDDQLQDSSCIATLTPVITDDFHALNNIGWYQIA